ncbi:MAG: phosphate acyltransferase PlsX [Herpetosiphonaceae bacterium]|nr:phosphate acyltransferase PlsX [Herpetosiphonaceae bacterium]
MKIVLDVSGGDHAPQATVAGAVQAARELGVEVVLAGDEQMVRAELAKHNAAGLRLPIVHAPEVIDMTDHAGQAARRKKASPVAVGLRMVRDKEAEAFVSAGHSGATMAGAVLIVGRVPGIERPCLAAPFPSVGGNLIVADVGATTDCKPEYLVQFAHMTSLYAQRVMGIHNPRVALLANGEEATKGDKLVQETHALLQGSTLNFVGNAEPKDALAGDVVDVLITDGFVGNLFLKQAEAVAKFATVLAKRTLVPRLFWRVTLGLLPTALLVALGRSRGRVALAGLIGGPALLAAVAAPLAGLRTVLDYRAGGGAPLLGVNGVVIIAHGKSDAVAVANAIRRAKEAVEGGLVAAITDADQHVQISATLAA